MKQVPRRHLIPSPYFPSLSSSVDSSSEIDVNDVFVLSIDGTLVASSRLRSQLAVMAAIRVWPSLVVTMETLGMDISKYNLPLLFEDNNRFTDKLKCHDDNGEDNDGNEWLIHKLSSLSSITQYGNDQDLMLGCDSVLLARLLIEEQLLDEGRSNGRGGKYGGKFHPSSSSSSSSGNSNRKIGIDDGGRSNRSVVGRCPLTVGELYANWSELREVTRIRYPVVISFESSSSSSSLLSSSVVASAKLVKEDPLPHIRRHMEQLYHEYNQWNKIGNYDGNSNNKPPPPPWLSLVKDILFDQISSSMSLSSEQRLRKNMILLLSHAIQLPMTLRAISLLGYDLYIDVTDLESWGAYYSFDDVMLSKNKNKCKMKVIVTTSNKISKRRHARCYKK